MPFWDAGEFIAVSYILGIPHPPGTPFFVLLGAHLHACMPVSADRGIARRVDALSAVSAALGVVVTYLTVARVLDTAAAPRTGSRKPQSDEWIAIAGAFVGALMLAFSDTFWENSIEAEVYSAHEPRPDPGVLAGAQVVGGARGQADGQGRSCLCVYVMWL